MPPLATAPAEQPAAAAAPKEKIALYMAGEDAARARAAFTWTRPIEGHRSWSDFLSHAVMAYVNQLEDAHHDGEPWPPIPTGRLAPGRPPAL